MKIHKYILEIAVFICGAVVMIFELVGSRVLGPYFGTSIFVWTSLIGIILGSLSLGYYLGGKISDKRPSINFLSLIIFLAAIFIGLSAFAKEPLLLLIYDKFENIKTGSVIASLVLFLPTSLLLGMVSPYAAKLRIKNLDVTGSTVGNLYAISSAGSIAGTFLSGFYLIPHFGTNKLLYILAAALLLLSAVLSGKKLIKTKFCILIIFLLGWIMTRGVDFTPKNQTFFDVDTAYNRIWIYNFKDEKTNKMMKIMGINNEPHSLMFLDSHEPVGELVNYYYLAKYFNPDFNKVLMLGGAGYSLPKDLLTRYPKTTIDVVEIDPAVTELAKKHFRLKEDPRLRIFHEDGRVYLNRNKEKYDAVFGDAFNSKYSIPYQLTTKEAAKRIYDALNENGVVVLNTISAIEGESGQFLRAEYATYKSIFPQVYLFPVDDSKKGGEMQNVILLALKSETRKDFYNTDPNLDKYFQHLWLKEIENDVPILTDDFAPVEYYINKMIKKTPA